MEKTIFAREYINSWYSTRMYYLAKNFSEIPLQILFPMIYCCIVYWMTAEPNDIVRVGLLLLSSIMISLVAQSVGLLIGAATSVQNAVFLGPVGNITFLLFCGFFINLDTIPHYLQWLFYISYVRYCYQSMLRGYPCYVASTAWTSQSSTAIRTSAPSKNPKTSCAKWTWLTETFTLIMLPCGNSSLSSG